MIERPLFFRIMTGFKARRNRYLNGKTLDNCLNPEHNLKAQEGAGPMPMQQLIYASQPFGFSEAGLAGILAVSRIRNAQQDITGALVCRPDIYIQLLEGPTGKVETLYDKICEDDRHVNMTLLVRAKIEDRLFPGWAMKHDPAKSWLWSPEEIRNGAIESATVRDVREVFLRVANQGGS